MASSRRQFVKQSVAAVGAFALVPTSCRRPSHRSRPASAPGADTGFEPAYLELERSGELARRE